jgi:hypothetical protein
LAGARLELKKPEAAQADEYHGHADVLKKASRLRLQRLFDAKRSPLGM